ncbi:MAG: hypothetical protein HRU19_27135 [Pseudobacteriovorax sp.]|nr:hypothetical protein [Pseudobacteriovorax sp.]
MLRRAISLAALSIMTPAFSTQAAELYEKDLAIIISHQADKPITISHKNEPIFKQAWLEKVQDAYRRTSVGDTLRYENWTSDWRLVSLRLVPCSPIGNSILADQDIFCWPELRQVWQPVMENFKGRVIRHDYWADDRAIHVLYDVFGTDRQRQVQALSSVKEQLDSDPSGQSIAATTLQEFLSLRDQVVQQYLSDIEGLRTGGYPEAAYQGHGLRPEYNHYKIESDWQQKLMGFLTNYSPTRQIKALTSFSLPEGREPAQIDEWVFLSFVGENGKIKQESIEVLDRLTGKRIISIGTSEQVSMRRDDPILYDFYVDNPQDQEMLRSSLLLFETDRAFLRDKIADRRQHLVPNTTCGTCTSLMILISTFITSLTLKS